LRHAPVGKVINSDGATPHFSRRVLAFLDRKFPDGCVGSGEHIPWPPCSPDLTLSGFFMWLFVKDVVYREIVQNVNELCDKIVRAAECVSNEIDTST